MEFKFKISSKFAKHLVEKTISLEEERDDNASLVKKRFFEEFGNDLFTQIFQSLKKHKTASRQEEEEVSQQAPDEAPEAPTTQEPAEPKSKTCSDFSGIRTCEYNWFDGEEMLFSEPIFKVESKIDDIHLVHLPYIKKHVGSLLPPPPKNLALALFDKDLVTGNLCNNVLNGCDCKGEIAMYGNVSEENFQDNFCLVKLAKFIDDFHNFHERNETFNLCETKMFECGLLLPKSVNFSVDKCEKFMLGRADTLEPKKLSSEKYLNYAKAVARALNHILLFETHDVSMISTEFPVADVIQKYVGEYFNIPHHYELLNTVSILLWLVRIKKISDMIIERMIDAKLFSESKNPIHHDGIEFQIMVTYYFLQYSMNHTSKFTHFVKQVREGLKPLDENLLPKLKFDDGDYTLRYIASAFTMITNEMSKCSASRLSLYGRGVLQNNQMFDRFCDKIMKSIEAKQPVFGVEQIELFVKNC